MLPSAPPAWTKYPAWTLCRSREEFKGQALPLLSMSAAHGLRYRDLSEGRAPSEDLSGYRVVHSGDLVVNKLSARDGALAVSAFDGIVSPAYWVVRLDADKVLPRFLHHLLRSSVYLAELARRSKFMPPAQFDLPWEQFRSLPVLLPPLDEQRRIADFLDDQVALLDQAINLRQQEIDLLNERQRAMTAVALAGVLPFGPTKHHPLLGEVNADWPILRLKQILSSSGVGVVVNPSGYFMEEGGVPFVHGGNVRDGYFDLSNVRRLSQADSERLARSRLQLGDVVVVRAGYPGRAAVVTRELVGANCASVLLLRPYTDRVIPHWIETFFNARQGRSQVSLVQYGAAQEQINLGDVVEFSLPVPEVAVQRQILAEVLAVREQCHRLAALYGQSLSLLQERKQALIVRAVLGHLDVATARKVAS